MHETFQMRGPARPGRRDGSARDVLGDGERNAQALRAARTARKARAAYSREMMTESNSAPMPSIACSTSRSTPTST